MKKYLWIFLCVLLVGCGQVKDEEVVTEERVSIGLSFDSFVVERWQRDRDVFVSTANELGAEVNVQNANGDAAKQLEQLEYFIEKEVDVIVVVPIESKELASVIKKAQDKGIKVISYDRIVFDAGTDLYVSFDNEAVGRLMGKELTKRLQKGANVIMVCGPETDSNVTYVKNGFLSEVANKDFNILDTTYIEGWKSELAGDYLRENIDLLENAEAIMCGNDALAGEVIEALAENRLAGEILVTGQDADLSACQRVVEGTQIMTVYKPVEKLARLAAENAVALANGENIEAKEYINDGSYEVPYLKFEPLAVTSENIDATIIDSGFHTHEDVYFN